MTKALQIISFTILFSNFSYAQNIKLEKENTRYFNENYEPISQMEFHNRKWRERLLSIEGDSINHKILLVREKHGRIENKNILDSILISATNKNIDSSKPLVIIYYPGKDSCNSTGTATRRSFRRWYNKMEKGVNKIKESTFIYVYKEKEGLFGRNDAFKDWIEDPENIVEKLFFKRHYPCSSFVVISEEGEFISYFGEFSKEIVWKATEILSEG